MSSGCYDYTTKIVFLFYKNNFQYGIFRVITKICTDFYHSDNYNVHYNWYLSYTDNISLQNFDNVISLIDNSFNFTNILRPTSAWPNVFFNRLCFEQSVCPFSIVAFPPRCLGLI